MPIQPSVYPLQGKVQHYAWGGYHYIPGLCNIQKNHQPFAEYWLGAHPAQSATVTVQQKEMPLVDFINKYKNELLGTTVANEFGRLPYLLKVLDVRQMLSIQVHPDKKSAEKGFAEENEKGIALTAFNRNYKDDNHKPELMVALSDFWLLHGFKPAAALKETLSAVPYFEPLVTLFEKEGYKGLYAYVMTMPQADVNKMLQPVIDRIMPLYNNGELKKEEENFWAARAAETFCKGHDLDRGIFSIYFFNLVHLKKGEGIYQPAGLPHAYLEGQNIEIMANSDNVLRAGLTDKYIDIAELMQHVRFEATEPDILYNNIDEPETVYKSEATEFELSAVNTEKDEALHFETKGPETVLVIEGTLLIKAADEQYTLQKGEAAFIKKGAKIFMNPTAGTVYFKVSVPGL